MTPESLFWLLILLALIVGFTFFFGGSLPYGPSGNQ